MLACSALDDATEAGAASAFEGAIGAALTRSSRFGGWTALVVTIAPPANPTAIAANAVPIPAK